MLSYQHAYHAGCFADVLKHVVLTRILQYLIKKDKPLFYLETHSGRGLYDLKDRHALKTGEAQDGIELIWNARTKLPTVFKPYIQTIRNLNPNNTLRYYPGSPLLAIETLRTQDRLVLCELHSGEFEHLQQLAISDKRVFLSNSDGVMQLKAQLPPIERRGLIFVDPAYELKSEYKTIPEAIKSAYQRFATGTYCIWYPIIDNKLHGQLIRGLKSISDNHLQVEFYLNKKAHQGMNGCGLWIINPPFVLVDELKQVGHTLKQIIHAGSSSFLIQSS